ncbi:MAG: hypothetical protein GX241_03715 [Ruminococcaceae bacterium]|nr:hypothetical protein [Oscillospiraceae bacterium]
MDNLIAILSQDIPAGLATVGLCIYFLGMAVTFLFFPVKVAEQFAIKPIGGAGITEIRVYYGGISFALGAFLLFLAIALKNPIYSLCGGLFFATTVLVVRTIFTFVDKGWKDSYTKLAIPAESVFVIALWVCYFLADKNWIV